ncbi:MAG: DMT family transporter [Hyphomicrobiaceae bacterium]
MSAETTRAVKLGARIPNLALEAGVVIGWSSGFVGAILAATTVSIFSVLLWRFIIVALALLPWLWPIIRHPPGWRWFLLHGAIGFVGMFCCLSLGIKAIDIGAPAGTAALIGALQPLMTAVLAGPVLGEHVVWRQWLGLLIGLAGVVIAVGAPSPGETLGYVLAFGSTLSIVTATLLTKARWDGSDFLASFAFQSLVTVICTLPFAWADGALLPTWDGRFAAAVAWAILISTAGGYAAYYLAVQRMGAVRVGSLIYLTPPVTMLWAWAMFGQPMTVAGLAGFAVCLVGVYLARGEGNVARR